MRLLAGLYLTLLLAPSLALSTGLPELLTHYETLARQSEPSFRASAERGDAFYHRVHKARPGADAPPTSCADCHLADPRKEGLNTRNRKKLEPLAPSANPRRFSDSAKVEKWFSRNCGDVLDRACTHSEKSDLIAWLMTLQ